MLERVNKSDTGWQAGSPGGVGWTVRRVASCVCGCALVWWRGGEGQVQVAECVCTHTPLMPPMDRRCWVSYLCPQSSAVLVWLSDARLVHSSKIFAALLGFAASGLPAAGDRVHMSVGRLSQLESGDSHMCAGWGLSFVPVLGARCTSVGTDAGQLTQH